MIILPKGYDRPSGRPRSSAPGPVTSFGSDTPKSGGTFTRKESYWARKATARVDPSSPYTTRTQTAEPVDPGATGGTIDVVGPSSPWPANDRKLLTGSYQLSTSEPSAHRQLCRFAQRKRPDPRARVRQAMALHARQGPAIVKARYRASPTWVTTGTSRPSTRNQTQRAPAGS